MSSLSSPLHYSPSLNFLRLLCLISPVPSLIWVLLSLISQALFLSLNSPSSISLARFLKFSLSNSRHLPPPPFSLCRPFFSISLSFFPLRLSHFLLPLLFSIFSVHLGHLLRSIIALPCFRRFFRNLNSRAPSISSFYTPTFSLASSIFSLPVLLSRSGSFSSPSPLSVSLSLLYSHSLPILFPEKEDRTNPLPCAFFLFEMREMK